MPGRLIPKTWESNPVIYAPARYKKACRYESFVPDELQSMDLHLPVEIAGLVAEAEAAIRGLNRTPTPALAPLAKLLLRTESIASSKVEGMHMDMRVLMRAEATIESGGKRNRSAMEILDNIAAMETAIHETASVPHFGEREISTIHHRLMQHDSRGTDGRFRTGQNWIGGNDHNPCGADFVPPPVEEVPRLLRDLCTTVNSELFPPLVQAALVHAQFETIHPFDDGNGRTGRALIHVVLRRRGVAPAYAPPISVVLAAGRDRYINGLTAYRGDGVLPWIEHFSLAAAKSANLAHAYLSDVEALMVQWRDSLQRAAAPRADATAWAVIDLLPAHPVVTGAGLIRSMAQSKGPIYEALRQLEEAGVLIPLPRQSRAQSWEPAGLIDLLESLEAGRPQ